MTDIDIDRVIVMSLEDRTPFEAIHIQFRLSESEVIHLMRRKMKGRNIQCFLAIYQLWGFTAKPRGKYREF
jgi:uncharacterized protein (TIGR03643 family)